MSQQQIYEKNRFSALSRTKKGLLDFFGGFVSEVDIEHFVPWKSMVLEWNKRKHLTDAEWNIFSSQPKGFQVKNTKHLRNEAIKKVIRDLFLFFSVR